MPDKYTNKRIVVSWTASRLKSVPWVGSSRKDVKSFPRAVRLGHALYAAQKGQTDPAAKAVKGFGGRGVLEIVTDHRSDTSRSVYTVRFEVRFTCYTPSRRNQNPASPRRRRKWTLFAAG